jgi:hypothetical protein
VKFRFCQFQGKNLPKPSSKAATKTTFSAPKSTDFHLQDKNITLVFSRLKEKFKKVLTGVTPYQKNTIFATAKTTRRSLKLMPI